MLILQHLHRKCIIWMLAFTALLWACQAPSQDQRVRESITPLGTPDEFLSPPSITIAGTGLVGRLISISDNAPLGNTVVRLAKVFWNEEHSEGVYVLEGARSPSCITDDKGTFIFAGIGPGDYVMIVGDVYGHHIIVSNVDGSARIFSLEEGNVLDVGQLQVAFP